MTDSSDPLHFTPVPRHRSGARGWTADAQRAFIHALSRCGVVAAAARSVGCSPRSAYQLRQRPGADSFAAAWDWAIEIGLDESRTRALALIMDREQTITTRRDGNTLVRTRPATRVMLAALRALDVERSGLRNLMPHRQRMAAREAAARAAHHPDRTQDSAAPASANASRPGRSAARRKARAAARAAARSPGGNLL
jgi:hypothetical protein